jgi:hypothetical protein
LSVEKAIHERWSLWKPLEDLLPVARVLTGEDNTESPTYPLCILGRLPGGTTERTSSCLLEAVVIRFDVRGTTLESVKPVANELREHFNKADFNYSLGSVLDCRPVSPALESIDPNGLWHAELDIQFRTSQDNKR